MEDIRKELIELKSKVANSNLYELDKLWVFNLINEHLSGQINRRLLVWSLLSFEWWLKEFLK